MSNNDVFDMELNDTANDTLQNSDQSDEEPIQICDDLVKVWYRISLDAGYIFI